MPNEIPNHADWAAPEIPVLHTSWLLIIIFGADAVPGVLSTVVVPVTVEPEQNIVEVDLVIVPGLVFDEKLARYGRGRGYYDRFLCMLSKQTIVIAVGYDFQVMSHKWRLGLKSHDVKMDYIITEKRIIQKKGTFFY